jgi:hypothetical protein
MSMENSRKVFRRIRYTKSSPNTQKVFKLIRRIRRKYFIKYEENAKIIVPHSPGNGVKFAQSPPANGKKEPIPEEIYQILLTNKKQEGSLT